VLGSLSYAMTPDGAGLPLAALAWLEDWMFILADGAFITVLVLALPWHARPRLWSSVTACAAVVLAAAAVSNMVSPHRFDNPAGLANPFGVPTLAPLNHVGIAGYLAVTLLGVLLTLARGTARSLARDRSHRLRGRLQLTAAALIAVLFVSQAALTGEGSGVVAAVAACALRVAVAGTVGALGAASVLASCGGARTRTG
jgi:hypothetical protein